MVQLSIIVRPTTAYNAPNKTREITVDTSQRVEDIVTELKLEKKGTHFYANGRELPLNSSLASHNIQDGDVLESCACPALSAVLSAVLRDLDAVDKLEDDKREETYIRPLLDGVTLDPWPGRWSRDDIKTRKICLAFIKKVLQRNERFEDTQVPRCEDLTSMCAFMKQVWEGEARQSRHNSMAHIIKPAAKNRNGKPTTCWELLQNKLDMLARIASALGPTQDGIEEFVRADRARHKSISTPRSTAPVARTPTSTPRRVPRRKLQLQPSPATLPSVAICSTCGSSADSICLTSECPFHKLICCVACFQGNHPSLQREHERVLLTDQRARPISRAQNRGPYIPEYASGAYAILCTLFEVSEGIVGPREFSLDESRLKKLAQRRCRSNLYDRQARGRNAFSCIESLTDKGFIRKELIPEFREAKFSLRTSGEAMGRCCSAFETALNQTLFTREMTTEQSDALAGSTAEGIRLIVDTREDATYADRLVDRCKDGTIDYDRRELPAGDYVYTIKADSNDDEIVLPVVVERKSWSDLADSVTGRGQRRLDCVRIDGSDITCHGRCQLCRMKRSGCATVLFVIEGARCLNRDHEEKCSDASRCKYCKELVERHGPTVVQEELEQVLFKLQVDHGCLIHFTRGYNETIDSLLLIRSILGKRFRTRRPPDDGRSAQRVRDLPTYKQFCKNARRSTGPIANFSKGALMLWTTEEFTSSIHKGRFRSRLPATRGRVPTVEPSETVIIDAVTAKRGPVLQEDGIVVLNLDSDDSDEVDSVELNESQQSVYVLEDDSWINSKKRARSGPTKKPKSQPENACINLDSDHEENSDDCVQLIGVTPAKKKSRIDEDHVVVVVLDGTTTKGGKRSAATKRTSEGKEKEGTPTLSSLPLIIIQGMPEYDKEYHEDLNKIWKSLYKAHSNADGQGFQNQSKQKIRTLCSSSDDESPLVPREVVLFWGLYVQLHEGVAIHFTRMSSGMRSLQNAWLKTNRNRTGQTTVARQESGNTTPARRSLDFEETPLCLLCRERIGDRDGFTTPCKHLFHHHCLSAWVDNSTARQCPHCNSKGIGLPKNRPSQKGRSSTTQGRPPRRSVSSGRQTIPLGKARETATDDYIRQARLRRFSDRAGDAKPTALPMDNPIWLCQQCTLENEISSSLCGACGVQRSKPKNSDLLHASTKDDRWSCDECTFENLVSANICTLCSASNPFVSHDCESVRASSVDARQSTPVYVPVSSSIVAATGPPDTSQSSGNTSSIATAPVSTGSMKKGGACGACRLRGHNRASATRTNCPEFNNPDEIDARERKKIDAQRIAREKGEEAARFVQRNQEMTRTQATAERELQRSLAEVQRFRAENQQIAEAEAHRKQKAADRAEKRARRLAG